MTIKSTIPQKIHSLQHQKLRQSIAEYLYERNKLQRKLRYKHDTYKISQNTTPHQQSTALTVHIQATLHDNIPNTWKQQYTSKK
jgi:hypothetical protein